MIDTLDPLSRKLENENVELEFQVLNYAKENTHLKTTYKNLFDSIKVTWAQTKAIIDSLQDKLHDTIYENAKLRAELFDNVSEQKDTNKVFPKVGESNALSKPVTSNSAPSSRESMVMNNERVIALGIFRINPFKASRYVNGMKSRKKNQSANVSKSANQKKHKPKVRKPKKVGSKERLASPKPSTPSSCLRWSPTGRMFDLKGKIIATSESVCQSDCSKGDNACTSNPQEPICKRTKKLMEKMNVTIDVLSAMACNQIYDSHDVNDRVGKSIRSSVRRIIQMEKIKLFQSLPLLLLLMHPININNNKIQLPLLQL
ncbi:hypothetical protein Tco_0663447 [Tanacetum coccineum]